MRRIMVGAAIVVVLAVTAFVVHAQGNDSARLVVGKTTTTQSTALPTSTIVTAPPTTPAPVAPAVFSGGSGPVTLLASDGAAYGNAIAFTSSVVVPSDLQFVLVIGSDARPGQDPRRANGDSIHILAVNPRTMEGTILGFPRDSWVDIPGHGRGKITSSLAMGGPSLMVDTVRKLTGLPIQYYVITGFAGLPSMVDALGGVNVLVPQRMNDANSGARFEKGWHRMDGAQALAFSRDRHDVPNGDFSRSSNQASLMLAAMGKLRAEVGDDGGLRRWADVLLRYASLDVPPDQLLPLAALGRRIDPARIRNVVAPGRVGTAGRASVVYLAPEAATMFADLRADAVIGGESFPAPTASTVPGEAPTTAAATQPTTTTTTSPPDTLLPPVTLSPPP
ncbi:MAG TPA: LCP family protein [Acidimicrobiales bacterium]|nr:LCP family protein [Acidimicrobiales bacterium]